MQDVEWHFAIKEENILLVAYATVFQVCIYAGKYVKCISSLILHCARAACHMRAFSLGGAACIVPFCLETTVATRFGAAM